MRPANLFSLIGAKQNLKEETSKKYLSSFKIQIRDDELIDLETFVKEFRRNFRVVDITWLSQFYVGYKIEQISKEFDLLRIGDDNIINIEIKREHTGLKVQKQLIQNKYYLSFLGKKIISFTYISETNKLLYLNDNSEIEEVDFEFLKSYLSTQKLKNMTNIEINTLFNPSNYLVSPFNSTLAFINDRYFLTNQQTEFKKKIFNLFNQELDCFISINGAAGTGKTLLTYDIAKDAQNRGKKIIIYHCGIINEGQETLNRDYDWFINPIKNLRTDHFKNFDLVIVDECQRIKQEQLSGIIQSVKENRIKCIFSYDKNQFLHNNEFYSNIIGTISEVVKETHTFSLSEKIRTNKELAAFTKNLFDLSKINNIQEYKNIDIQYFAIANEATHYMEMLEENNWKIIHYSSPLFNKDPYGNYQLSCRDSAHMVLGQEYDNVAVIIDACFYYNKSGILSSNHVNAYYRADKMLFQMVTRARNKLTVIIIDNEDLLDKCLKITNGSN